MPTPVDPGQLTPHQLALLGLGSDAIDRFNATNHTNIPHPVEGPQGTTGSNPAGDAWAKQHPGFSTSDYYAKNGWADGGAAVKKAVDGAKNVAGVLASPFGWIKELFSAQLWDRILFVLGGVILFIIGVVLILHKQLPTPLGA